MAATAPPSRGTLRLLLPPLQVIALVFLAGQVGTYAAYVAEASPADARTLRVLIVAHGGAALAIAGCWLGRGLAPTIRRRRAWTVAAAVAALPLLLGELALGLPLLVLVVALVVLDLSVRAGVVGIVAIVVPVVVIRAVEQGPGASLQSGLFLVGVLCFGLALGASWRLFQQAQERDLRLIAERDEAVARLERAVQRLRRATDTEKELLLADERSRAARDLHDGLGHRLTLIALNLEYALRVRHRDADEAWAEVGRGMATAQEAMQEMRTWVRALSPVRDAGATGLAAFDAIAESFRGTGLDVTVRHRGDADVPPSLGEDVSLLLYRAVQEGLTNALRHGGSRRATIELTTTSDDVTLQLGSDLGGEAASATPDGRLTPGFGLRGLAGRAEALGGTATAVRTGGEVVLTVRVPARPVSVGVDAGDYAS